LERTENTVLWLVMDNPWSCTALQTAAQAKGIDIDRLIFADRVTPQQYLARLAVADLFLDTYPYNAGTVTSDVLRMGTPIVTLSGQTFASRMAGSLCQSAGIGDLVATNLGDYINIAVSLAQDPVKYQSYRAKLQGDTWRQTIGNIENFMGHYEAAMKRVVKRPS